MFSKKGNYFPNRARTPKTKITYPAAIAAALQTELGDSHRAIKTVMRWTGASERTVKNWLAGTKGPRGEHLLGLIRHSNLVLEVVLQLTSREQVIVGNALLDARNALVETLTKIDQWLGGAHGGKERV